MSSQFALTSTFLLLFFASNPATAQLFGGDSPLGKPPAGMRSMKITPQEEPKTTPPTAPAPAITAAPVPQPQSTAPVYKPLSPESALVKEENLAPWSDLQLAAIAHSKSDLARLEASIEGNRGAVPPQGLFLAAKDFADQNQMEKAALYFFVGKLRLTFDKARWPAQLTPEDLAKLEEDSGKTPDQAKPNITAPIPRDPHKLMDSLSTSISSPILKWMMKDPARFQKALDDARDWDLSAPYAYTTGYETGFAIPFEKWPKALNNARTVFFRDMGMLAGKLTAIHKK